MTKSEWSEEGKFVQGNVKVGRWRWAGEGGINMVFMQVKTEKWKRRKKENLRVSRGNLEKGKRRDVDLNRSLGQIWARGKPALPRLTVKIKDVEKYERSGKTSQK